MKARSEAPSPTPTSSPGVLPTTALPPRVLSSLDCLPFRELQDGRNAIRCVAINIQDRIDEIEAELEDLAAELCGPLRDVMHGLIDLKSDLAAAASEIDEEISRRLEAR